MEVNEESVYKNMSESLLPQMTPAMYKDLSNPSKRRLLNRSNARSLIKFTDLPPSGYYGFIKDGFTTILNTRWYTIILIFCSSYIMSWLIFSFLWWGTEELYQHVYNSTCVSNVETFSSSFLFSLETQVTIGYGFRYISEHCSFGVTVLLLQCLVGLLLDSFMLGLVFAKLTRPRNRRKTILFSNLAVIRSINGIRCLEFRIADVRRSQLVEAHVRATIYWYKADEESGDMFLEQHDLDFGYDTGRDRLIMLAPVIVRHYITSNSPLYSIDESNIQEQDLEIVIALEGIVESTGLTVQALWSYTEKEILTNYRFRPMIYRRRNGSKNGWEINFSLLSQVIAT